MVTPKPKRTLYFRKEGYFFYSRSYVQLVSTRTYKLLVFSTLCGRGRACFVMHGCWCRDGSTTYPNVPRGIAYLPCRSHAGTLRCYYSAVEGGVRLAQRVLIYEA